MPNRMSDKNDTVTSKKRKTITLQTKYDIITEQEAGTSVTALASKYSFGKSMISMILKDKEIFLKEVKKACPLQSRRVRNKDVLSLIPHLENILSAWIADQTQRLKMHYHFLRHLKITLKANMKKHLLQALAGFIDIKTELVGIM